jgi:hypothetical protein
MTLKDSDNSSTRNLPLIGISIYELGSLLIGNGIIFVLFHLLKGQVYLDIVKSLRTFIRFEDPAFIVGLLSLLAGVVITRGEKIRPQAMLASCVCALMLGVSTTIMEENYAILRGPWVKGMILLGALLAGALSPKKVLTTVIILAFPIFIFSFLSTLGGETISSDDHASFIFRLSVLKDHFPNIPFYYPGWNAGLDARDFFATGTLNVFFLFFPLIILGDITTIYPLIISTLLFILLPLSTFFGSRALGLSRLAALIASALAVCSNLFWYRWALKYGPIGFVTSASLLPFIYGYGWSLFYGESKATSSKKILFILASSLALCWAPAGLALSPLLLAAIVSFILYKERRGELLKIALTIGLIMAPFAIMITAVSNPGKFLQVEKVQGTGKNQSSLAVPPPSSSPANSPTLRGKKKEITYDRIETNLRDALVGWNYVVLFLAFAGIILFQRSSARRLYYTTVLTLTTLGAVVSIIKPQLELDRMLVLLGILLSIPAANAVYEIVQWWYNKNSYIERAASLFVTGFILAGIFSVGLVVKNRTLERFYIRSEDTGALISTLKNLPGNGRIFFSGCILHELDGGHFAPLSLATKKALVGSAPFHTLWWYTSSIPDYIAKAGEKAISDFINLYNADYVIAHEPTWISFFDKHPHNYKHIRQVGKFVIFEKLDRSNSYILEGEASSLTSSDQSISLTPTTSELTIKFRYFSFLQSSSCKITPKEVASELSFIHLSECIPGQEVTIHSVSPMKRMQIELLGKNE